MTIKISKIKRDIVPLGKNEGRVCTFVKIDNGISYKPETLLSKIVEIGTKLVYIEGDFTTNSEIVTVVKHLHDGGYKVIFSTDSGDDVGAIVRYRNVSLSILINIPVDGVELNYISHIIGYLKEEDEARFKIENQNDYMRFRKYQKIKNIKATTKILEVKKEYKANMEKLLIEDVSDMNNLIIKYI